MISTPFDRRGNAMFFLKRKIILKLILPFVFLHWNKMQHDNFEARSLYSRHILMQCHITDLLSQTKLPRLSCKDKVSLATFHHTDETKYMLKQLSTNLQTGCCIKYYIFSFEYPLLIFQIHLFVYFSTKTFNSTTK